MQFFHYNSNIV